MFFSKQIIYSKSDRLSALSEALACTLGLDGAATDSLCRQYVKYPSIK